MNEDIYEIYKSDADFHDYVDRFCKARKEGIFETLEKKIVQEVGKEIVKRKQDKR